MENIRNTLMVALAASGLMLSGAVLADDISKETKQHSKTEYKEAVHKAEADYKTAKAHCDSMKGNDKDVCIKDAKAAEKKAKAEAKAQHKSTAARAEAGEDTREAEYKAAKEKCDAMSGDAKDNCVTQAKAKYKQ
jgi:hypothetical protein